MSKTENMSNRIQEQRQKTRGGGVWGEQPAFTSLEIITHEYAGICGSEFKMSNVFLLPGWLS